MTIYAWVAGGILCGLAVLLIVGAIARFGSLGRPR